MHAISFFIGILFIMRLKRYKKKTIGSHIAREIIIIVMGIVIALLIITYYSHRFNEVVMPIAEAKTRKYITETINNAADKIMFDNDLFVIEKSNDNEIKMITYNSYEATKLINEITYNIEDKLDKLEDNYVIGEIPFGVVYNNALLRNMGPRIKIKIEIVGDVLSELETEVKPYGINNALVEVRVKLYANAKVIVPLVSKDISITNVIPISINIVNGSIPEAYIGTYH